MVQPGELEGSIGELKFEFIVVRISFLKVSKKFLLSFKLVGRLNLLAQDDCLRSINSSNNNILLQMDQNIHSYFLVCSQTYVSFFQEFSQQYFAMCLATQHELLKRNGIKNRKKR